MIGKQLTLRRKFLYFLMSVAINPDLIEKNQGNFGAQTITINLIPLENSGRFFFTSNN